MEESPIGIFDSGLGGLTVMQQMMRTLPHEHMVYFGDTARLPYGNKSPETIIRYSMENAAFLAEKNIKLLVVACNTASAHALDVLQHKIPIPVVGVIVPGATTALHTSSNKRIAILGTKGTIQSQRYQEAIRELDPQAFVLPIACPLFVPFVEEGYCSHPATRLVVHEYLKPIKENRIDTVLLGCTHYPFLKEMIQEEVGDEVAIVDSAASCAHYVAQALERKQLRRPSFSTAPCFRYFASDDPQQFQRLGSAFLGTSISSVELISR